MGALTLDYSDLKSTISASKSAGRNLESYADSLDRKVTQKISDLGFSTSRTNDANWFARKKTENLRKKAYQYSNFAKKLENFGELAEAKDKAVRDKFDSLYSTFKTKNNIQVSPIKEFFVNLSVGICNSTSLGRWVKDISNKINTSFKGVCNEIEEWYKYKGGKYIVDIGKSVLAIGFAIFTICTAGAGFFAVCAIVGAALAIINAVNNICTSTAAINYSNSDPAMAARYGRMDTLSDTLKKNNFKNKFVNRGSLYLAMGLDTVQIFTDIVGVTGGVTTFYKNSKNISSIKNLFSGPEGLKTKFLKIGEEGYKATPKSFYNGFKTIKNDKSFWGNLGKNFKKDLRSDKFSIASSFKDKKSSINFAKNTIISSIKGNKVDKVISRDIIKQSGKNVIINIFKQSDKNKSFDGSFKRIGINKTMPKPITEGIRFINRADDILKLKGVDIINGLNLSQLKKMKDIGGKIKSYKKSNKKWVKYTSLNFKATKLSESYVW